MQKHTPDGPVLTYLWLLGNCSSQTMCCWETRMNVFDPTSRVLLDPLLQRNRTVQVFCGISCSFLMLSGSYAQRASAGQVAPTVLGLGTTPMNKQDIASTT